MIVIGTDEAGYGPNYGPLVVSSTVWETPSEEGPARFASDLRSSEITIDDSKKVYHGGGTLAPLESAVLAVFRHLGLSRKEYLEQMSVAAGDGPSGFPDLSPVVVPAEAIVASADRLAETLKRHTMRIEAVRSRIVFPEEFNRLLGSHDSKGSLLSGITLRLVAESIPDFGDAPVLVLCDKHGGRNRYLDLLTEFFPGEFIRVLRESREESVYRLNGDRLEFRFSAKGDSQVPVALASMVSKYLRELAMIRFNEFWQAHLPGLRPTAGYPEDARRFRQEIAATQKELGISDDSIWRKR